jgi:hypothetical protein
MNFLFVRSDRPPKEQSAVRLSFCRSSFAPEHSQPKYRLTDGSRLSAILSTKNRRFASLNGSRVSSWWIYFVDELNGADWGLDWHFIASPPRICCSLPRRSLKLCSWAPDGLNKESSMNNCDWTDCLLEVGLFDGAPRTLLSDEGHKNIPVESRFINLCREHFELGVATRSQRRYN